MPDGSIDLGSLEGDALTRWYLRSPAEIEQERQDAAAKRHQDFFYGTFGADPDAGFAQEAPAADHDADPDLAVSPPSTSQSVVPGFTWAQVGPNRFRSVGLTSDEPSTLRALSHGGPTRPEDPGDIGRYQDAGPPEVASSQLSLAPPPGAQFDGALREPPTVAFGQPRSPTVHGVSRTSEAAPTDAQAVVAPHPIVHGPIHLGPATPPLPTFFSSMFGGPVPLTNPEGRVVGYYDHQAARAGLELTGRYAQIAPWLQPAGWMDGLIASGAPRIALSAVAPAAHLVESGLKGPLNFLEREAWQRGAQKAAQALTDAEKTALRAAARAKFARANGISASEMQAEVHHSDPLEWAHLKPDADPNRLANLWGLRKEAHGIPNREWAAFSKSLEDRLPSQAELMEAKLRIDRLVAPYIRRAGLPRSNRPPGKGGPL